MQSPVAIAEADESVEILYNSFRISVAVMTVMAAYDFDNARAVHLIPAH